MNIPEQLILLKEYYVIPKRKKIENLYNIFYTKFEIYQNKLTLLRSLSLNDGNKHSYLKDIIEKENNIKIISHKFAEYVINEFESIIDQKIILDKDNDRNKVKKLIEHMNLNSELKDFEDPYFFQIYFFDLFCLFVNIINLDYLFHQSDNTFHSLFYDKILKLYFPHLNIY